MTQQCRIIRHAVASLDSVKNEIAAKGPILIGRTFAQVDPLSDSAMELRTPIYRLESLQKVLPTTGCENESEFHDFTVHVVHPLGLEL